jgi:hypothetical protein
MAKTGTWYKKLCDKQKKHVMKFKLGNEVGVMSFCSKAKPLTARALNRKTIDDKPILGGPKAPPKDGYAILPRSEGWKPRAFGKRQRSGCYLAR